MPHIFHPLHILVLLSMFSRAENCELGTFYDRNLQGCAKCGNRYPKGCTSLDNITLANCLRDCKLNQSDKVKQDTKLSTVKMNGTTGANSCGIGTHQSTLSGGCATCPDSAAGCDTFKPLYMKDYYSCMNCTASSCGIGTHQSTLSGGCATCPDTAAGCDTFKPLYMKDYESCMKCDSFTATTQTDNWLELDKCLSVAQLVRARQLSSKGTYQSLDGCDECPVAPKGCDTHRPLYMKIYRSCMKCFLTDTTTSIPSTSSTSSPAMSSSNTIWVVLGVLGGLIFVGLLFAKFILPCLIKWYKRRGSDKSDPEQILIPSENMDENQYQSDSADSNLAPTPVNRRPPSFNPRPTLPNPGPTPFNLGPTPFNQGPTPSNPGPTPFNPGPTTSNPGPTTSNPANMRVHLNADNQVNDLDKGNNEEVSVLEEYDETLRETEV